jgi:selenocysteine lyase/cysteine desulfurase
MDSTKRAAPLADFPVSRFGVEVRQNYFSFAQGYKPLNHGSLGTFPRTVAEYQRQLQLETEAKPDTFIRYTYTKLLQAASLAIAPLLGADVDEVVFIPNATTSINTVLRNIDFKEGDAVIHFNTIYGACLKTLQSVAERIGINLCCVNITYPIEDNEILERSENMVSSVQGTGTACHDGNFRYCADFSRGYDFIGRRW